MKIIRKGKDSQSGFSLIELMTVLVILTLIMGVVFGQLSRVQKRYKTEEAKLDLTQESREFMDQIMRDVRQSGFPNQKMYGLNVLAATPANDYRNAAELVKVSNTELWFEGDVDGDGQIDSVHYKMFDNTGAAVTTTSNCPCSIKRSQVVKVDGTAPMSQATNYGTELENVVNSAGSGGAGTNGSLAISGNSIMVSATGTTASVANDTIYAGLKPAPVFVAYDKSGNVVTLPVDISTLAGANTMQTIRTVKVTLNVLSKGSGVDLQNQMRPASSMTATARLNATSTF